MHSFQSACVAYVPVYQEVNVERHLVYRVQKDSAMREIPRTRHLSFMELLRAAKAEIKPFDPWEEQLSRLRGEVGSDGVARISTEGVFDALDLPRFQRTAEAGKRVKTIMQTLGWTPMRARRVTSRGRAARVRGYARMP
jgi:hypothetical protein